jgi:glycosyltransferase involved in cell wall biosynthesis
MNPVVDISVVVPIFNAEPYLENFIQSLLSQTYSKDSYEVIFVDNGSKDASRMIAEQYPQIKLVLEPERGPYAARNRGIAQASGAVIAFIDPDCLPSEDWLQNIADAMGEPVVQVVLGRRSLPPLPPMLSLLEAYENAKDEYVFHGQIKTLYYGYTNNMAVRKELFNELGPFLNIPRGADTIFVCQIAEAYSGGVIRYCPNVVVTHLEISSVVAYYRKVFLYGRHRVLNNNSQSWFLEI